MSNTREYKSDVFSMLMEYPELTLPDKRKTIFLNIHGNRDGVSEELSTVLDYFETSDSTDEYTRGLEERVKENRNDDEGELHDLGNEIGRKISPGHGGGACGWTCRYDTKDAEKRDDTRRSCCPYRIVGRRG